MITATFLAIFFIPLFFVTVVQLLERKKNNRRRPSDRDGANQTEGE
jgi:hypothetical protein